MSRNSGWLDAERGVGAKKLLTKIGERHPGIDALKDCIAHATDKNKRADCLEKIESLKKN